MVQKDFTCHGATKPRSHAAEPVHPEPVLCNKRRDCSEKPVPHKEEWPCLLQLEEAVHSNEDTAQPKMKNTINFKKGKWEKDMKRHFPKEEMQIST